MCIYADICKCMFASRVLFVRGVGVLVRVCSCDRRVPALAANLIGGQTHVCHEPARSEELLQTLQAQEEEEIFLLGPVSN